MYGGIVIISLAAAVFMGGQAASVPHLIGKDRATQAMSALLAAEQVTQMILPPVGGAFFALVGPLPALTINAATYLLSQTAFVTVPTLGPATPSGLPSLRTFAALSLSFNFFGLMAGAALIPFLKRSFGASDLVVGYVFGLMAVGSIFGSWFAGRVPRSWPFGRIIIVAYAADGIAFIPVMFTHKLAIAVAFLAITDAFVLFEVAQIVGWRMRIVPEALVGRVFGVARLARAGRHRTGRAAGRCDRRPLRRPDADHRRGLGVSGDGARRLGVAGGAARAPLMDNPAA
ncbi:MAG: hypothetical protein GIX01_09285 [Candidatus Eremiobacteraeota bacterium]|nr:hypothetical protein [Candidatus Eremiobacteraeota bacterium]